MDDARAGDPGAGRKPIDQEGLAGEKQGSVGRLEPNDVTDDQFFVALKAYEEGYATFRERIWVRNAALGDLAHRSALRQAIAAAVDRGPEPDHDLEREIVVPFTWDGLVGTVEAILDVYYPDAAFTSESGDKGAVFVAALHRALAVLRGPETGFLRDHEERMEKVDDALSEVDDALSGVGSAPRDLSGESDEFMRGYNEGFGDAGGVVRGASSER